MFSINEEKTIKKKKKEKKKLKGSVTRWTTSVYTHSGKGTRAEFVITNMEYTHMHAHTELQFLKKTNKT